jgi:hypothetical protein
MSKYGGGTRRSSRLTFRRRLLLIRTLLRAPTSRADLIARVDAELGAQGYPPGADAALKHDLDALKNEFGCTIRFSRSTGQYTLLDTGDLALLDLPDTALEALALLNAHFSAPRHQPAHAQVQQLLDRVRLLLPTERRATYNEQQNTSARQVGDPWNPPGN